MTFQYDIYCSPKSPRAVVDFGLLQVDEDKLLEKLDVLRTPAMFLDSASETSLPPLHNLSISSSSKNDDSSSISSISLEGDNLDEAPQRCIFSSYWKKVGGKPTCQVSTSTRSSPEEETLKATDASMSDQSYEHLLEKTESRRDSSSSQGRRRRLWDNRYVSQSEPALAQCLDLSSSLRKTQSCSAVTAPKQSILRKGRFSSGSVQQRRSSDSSVSFSAQVQVKYLKPVTENWAPRGWSKYFA